MQVEWMGGPQDGEVFGCADGLVTIDFPIKEKDRVRITTVPIRTVFIKTGPGRGVSKKVALWAERSPK